jgi:hypothetical protein
MPPGRHHRAATQPPDLNKPRAPGNRTPPPAAISADPHQVGLPPGLFPTGLALFGVPCAQRTHRASTATKGPETALEQANRAYRTPRLTKNQSATNFRQGSASRRHAPHAQVAGWGSPSPFSDPEIVTSRLWTYATVSCSSWPRPQARCQCKVLEPPRPCTASLGPGSEIEPEHPRRHDIGAALPETRRSRSWRACCSRRRTSRWPTRSETCPRSRQKLQ